jgi:hypothetical protein
MAASAVSRHSSKSKLVLAVFTLDWPLHARIPSLNNQPFKFISLCLRKRTRKTTVGWKVKLPTAASAIVRAKMPRRRTRRFFVLISSAKSMFLISHFFHPYYLNDLLCDYGQFYMCIGSSSRKQVPPLVRMKVLTFYRKFHLHRVPPNEDRALVINAVLAAMKRVLYTLRCAGVPVTPPSNSEYIFSPPNEYCHFLYIFIAINSRNGEAELLTHACANKTEDVRKLIGFHFMSELHM